MVCYNNPGKDVREEIINKYAACVSDPGCSYEILIGSNPEHNPDDLRVVQGGEGKFRVIDLPVHVP